MGAQLGPLAHIPEDHLGRRGKVGPSRSAQEDNAYPLLDHGRIEGSRCEIKIVGDKDRAHSPGDTNEVFIRCADEAFRADIGTGNPQNANCRADLFCDAFVEEEQGRFLGGGELALEFVSCPD